MKVVLNKVRKDKHRIQKSPRVAAKGQGSVLGGLKLSKLTSKIPNLGGKSKRDESKSVQRGGDTAPLLGARGSDYQTF